MGVHFTARAARARENLNRATRLWDGVYALEDAAARDLADVMRIAGNTLPERYDERFFLRLIEMGDPTFMVLRALASNRAVGFALAVRSSPYEGRLLLLALDPEHQRLGLGGRLLKEVERRLRQRGALDCNLEVRADNVQAITFYHRAGYEIRGQVPHFYADGARAVTMAKAL